MSIPASGQAAVRGSGPSAELAPGRGLLYPLDEFYRAEGREPPPAVELRGGDVPEPYRHLLVHDRDMTPTLEAFHGERIHLRILHRLLRDGQLRRQVVLTTDATLRPVEYGAIVIHCDRFPPAARERILLGHCPLGTILAEHEIEHSSQPRAFFSIAPDELMRSALAAPTAVQLFGRRNALLDPHGQILADIVELLPPAEGSGARRPPCASLR